MPTDKKVIQGSGNDISKLFNEQETRMASKTDQSIEEIAASINKEFIRISDRFELAHERINDLEKTSHKGFAKLNEELHNHSAILGDHNGEFTKIQDEITERDGLEIIKNRVMELEKILLSQIGS